MPICAISSEHKVKVHLPDSAREAFQFLSLGIGLLVVLRLAYAGLVLWMHPPVTTPFAVAIDGLRNGYLFGDRQTWSVGGVDLPGRLAVAVLVALGGGIIGAVLGTGLDRALGRAGWKGAVLWARIGLILVGGLGVYSALFVAPTEVALTDAGIAINERPSLFGTLGLPITGVSETIAWQQIGDVVSREEDGQHVVYITGPNERMIASTVQETAAGELAQALRSRITKDAN